MLSNSAATGLRLRVRWITGVSPSVSTGEVWFSMIAYTLVYAALAVIEVKLFLTYVRRGADPFEEPVDPTSKGEDAPLEFAY